MRVTSAIVVLVSLLSGGAVDQTASPAPPRITAINHVAFRVSDPAAARKFYGGVLGLSEHSPSTGGPASFSIGHRQRIILNSGLRPEEDERLDHLAFETSDIKALRAYFASRNVLPPEGGSHESNVRSGSHEDDLRGGSHESDVRNGSRGSESPLCEPDAIRVADPDGHVIEFVQAHWPPVRPPPDSGRALSRRLLHAGLTIRDEEAAHRFYREVFGFSEIWRGGRKEGVTQWVNMRVPDGTDYLEYMLITTAPDRRQRGVLHHVALMVSDMQDAWEEAVRRSPDTPQIRLAPPQVGVNGRWQLNLFDPDGTRVELMEPFRVR